VLPPAFVDMKESEAEGMRDLQGLFWCVMRNAARNEEKRKREGQREGKCCRIEADVMAFAVSRLITCERAFALFLSTSLLFPIQYESTKFLDGGRTKCLQQTHDDTTVLAPFAWLGNLYAESRAAAAGRNAQVKRKES